MDIEERERPEWLGMTGGTDLAVLLGNCATTFFISGWKSFTGIDPGVQARIFGSAQ